MIPRLIHRIGDIEGPESQAPKSDIDEIKHIAKSETVNQIADRSTDKEGDPNREWCYLEHPLTLVIDHQRNDHPNAQYGKKWGAPLHDAEKTAAILASNDLQERADQLVWGR